MPPSSILTKAMGILDLIAASDAPLTLAEIAGQSRLPRSSAHRLLVLLRDAGALSYDTDTQTYAPGSRLMRWGVQTLQTNKMVTLATPHMTLLCREARARVALSILDENAVLFVHTIEAGAPFRLAPRVGEHSPLHASAAGKIFLADMDERRRADLLATYEFEKCTEFTATNAPALMTDIDNVHRHGFAVSAREEHRQTCGLAVPISNATGRTIAALSIWNVGEGDVLGDLKAHLPILRNAASEIQVSLGQAH